MSKVTCQPIIDKFLYMPGQEVLIVGVHTGLEAQQFIDYGKQVTGIDILPYYRKGYNHIRGRFEDVELLSQFDFALSSHTLEHMENVGLVLQKYQQVLKPTGYLGLVVPGYPQERFHVGHYTLWTPALLLYNLVANGWNCQKAEYYTSPNRQHIGVVVPNQRIEFDTKGWDNWEEFKTYLPVPFEHDMNAWIKDKWNG